MSRQNSPLKRPCDLNGYIHENNNERLFTERTIDFVCQNRPITKTNKQKKIKINKYKKKKPKEFNLFAQAKRFRTFVSNLIIDAPLLIDFPPKENEIMLLQCLQSYNRGYNFLY